MSHPVPAEYMLPLINDLKVDHDSIPVYTAFFRAPEHVYSCADSK